MLTVAVASGLRLKELCELRWDDVDDANGLIRVTTELKTGKGRVIPRTAAVREVLASIPKRLPRSAVVFVDSAGKPYRTASERQRVSTATRDTAVRAGLKEVSFHTLRHSCASWLVQAGIPLYEVQSILAQSTPTMTQKYTHLLPAHLRGAAAALDAVLGAPTESGNDTPVDTRPTVALAAISKSLSR